MAELMNQQINALLNSGSYPIYKDLEKYKVYDRDIVISLFDNNISIIKAIQEYCKNGTNDFKQHKESIENGFHYDKLLQTFHFNNRVVEEQVSLFSNFMKYSCNYHAEFLEKIYKKIYDLYYEIPPLFAMGNFQKKSLKMKQNTNHHDNNNDNKDDAISLNESNDENSDIDLPTNYINNDDASSLFDEDSENMTLLQEQSNNELFSDLQINDDIPASNENDDATSVVSSVSASSEKKKRGRPKKIKN